VKQKQDVRAGREDETGLGNKEIKDNGGEEAKKRNLSIQN